MTTKTIREERTIRFRAVKPGHEIRHEHKWWQVVRPVEHGETVTLKQGKEKPRDEVVDLYEGRVCGFVIQRGSLETVLYAGTNVLVKIIRTR